MRNILMTGIFRIVYGVASTHRDEIDPNLNITVISIYLDLQGTNIIFFRSVVAMKNTTISNLGQITRFMTLFFIDYVFFIISEFDAIMRASLCLHLRRY